MPCVLARTVTFFTGWPEGLEFGPGSTALGAIIGSIVLLVLAIQLRRRARRAQ